MKQKKLNIDNKQNTVRSKPKFFDEIKTLMRVRHYSKRTEEAYISWIRNYIYFHNKKHPQTLGCREINQYINNPAVNKNVSASTQNVALCAIVFLYKSVLKKELGKLDIIWAKKGRRLPVVFSKNEVKTILLGLSGVNWIMVNHLYGSGIRLMECVRLRIKDIDFEYNQVIIRNGKGNKDRVTILPETVKDKLKQHLIKVEKLHNEDIKRGFGDVFLPYALRKKI